MMAGIKKKTVIGPKHQASWFPFIMFLLANALNILLYIATDQLWLWGLVLGVTLCIYMSLHVANEWERAVVLRLGKYHGLRGPGVFWLIPFVDTVVYWIDQRIIATPFLAEQALTKDTVPVNVDAILFWMVWDPEKAALEVENYQEAVAWTAQTALRDVVGRFVLADILSGREQLDSVLQELIDGRTEPWGITVQSVEIRDVVIPEGLQEAMSREAQAERERRARIILGAAEAKLAERFVEAAQVYEGNEVALQLRAMNILYEGLKNGSGMVVTPSNVAETLQAGVAAATIQQSLRAREKGVEKHLDEGPAAEETSVEEAREISA